MVKIQGGDVLCSSKTMTVIWGNPLPSQPTTVNCFPHRLIIYHLNLLFPSRFVWAPIVAAEAIRLAANEGQGSDEADSQSHWAMGAGQKIALRWKQHHNVGSSAATTQQTDTISLYCTFTRFIHQVTTSGWKNGCSLNCQQLWSYCNRHTCYIAHTHTLTFV